MTQNSSPQPQSQSPSEKTTESSAPSARDASQKLGDDKAEKAPSTRLSQVQPGRTRKEKVDKQTEPTRGDVADKLSPQTINNAPNGIVISGGTVANPTVTNNNGLFPPGQTPTISICFVSQNVEKADSYETVFTLDTSVPISSPWWLFRFDGPVLSLVPKMESGHPFVSRSDHPIPKMVEHSGNVLVLNVDTSFLGSQAPWRPGDKITATLSSICSA